MIKNKLKISLLFCLLTACSMDPVYRRPCMDLPCSWRIESNLESTSANLRWWEALEDPVLNELIFTALQHNKDLGVAVWRVFEFFARYEAARSPLLPQVNLAGSGMKERIPPAASSNGQALITPFYSYFINFSYQLDLFGQLASQARSAYAEALSELQNQKNVILTIVSATAAAYIELRALDKQLEIAFQTLEDRREFLRLAILRFQGGLTSEIDVTQAAAAFEQALADVTIFEEKIPQQENLISILIGCCPASILRGRAINDYKAPPCIPTGVPAELLCQRPDIMAAELRLMAANADIGAARAAFFPQLSLTALFGGESFQFKNLFTAFSRAWQYGLNVAQPIFTGGLLTAQLDIAVAEKYQAIYAYEQTILLALKEVNDALIAYRQNQELVRVAEGNVSANKEYLRLSWLRYYNGQTDYLTVLDAETRLFNAQIQLTRAQGFVFISFTDLYKALGGGWVEDADCTLRKPIW